MCRHSIWTYSQRVRISQSLNVLSIKSDSAIPPSSRYVPSVEQNIKGEKQNVPDQCFVFGGDGWELSRKSIDLRTSTDWHVIERSVTTQSCAVNGHDKLHRQELLIKEFKARLLNKEHECNGSDHTLFFLGVALPYIGWICLTIIFIICQRDIHDTLTSLL